MRGRKSGQGLQGPSFECAKKEACPSVIYVCLQARERESCTGKAELHAILALKFM